MDSNILVAIIEGPEKECSQYTMAKQILDDVKCGPTFAGFPHSFLPFDSSYVGMVHTHPSGTAQPSVEDLHNFFGLVSVIVQYPYKKEDIYAWSSAGERVQLEVE